MRGNTRRRVLAEADWDKIIKGGVVLQGDFNAHSPDWNIHWRELKTQHD